MRWPCSAVVPLRPLAPLLLGHLRMLSSRTEALAPSWSIVATTWSFTCRDIWNLSQVFQNGANVSHKGRATPPRSVTRSFASFLSAAGTLVRLTFGKLQTYRKKTFYSFQLLCYRCTQAVFFGWRSKTNLRLHVEQVADSDVGVALAVPIPLREELVLSPGHVNPLGSTFCLVIYRGVRCCVPVVDELGLRERRR